METSPAVPARAAIEQASAIFLRTTGGQPTMVAAPELVIKRHHGARGRRADLAWRIDAYQQQSGVAPAAYRYWIDAQTGVLIDARSRIHHFDVTGTVTSMATPGVAPDTATNSPVAIPVPFAEVTSAAGTVYTDANGDFNFVGVNAALDVTVRYSGTFNDVVNDASAGVSHAETFAGVMPGQANSLTMNSTPDPLVTAQANALIGSDACRDFIKATNPTDTSMDFVVTSNTNLPDTCNAFYNGVSINFYPEGNGCVNTSYSTVVAHEMGHWLNDIYSTFNGFDGMGEGNADVWAMYVYDDPVVGMDFAGPGNHIRDGQNTIEFCGDDFPACYGGVHANGRPWMGAAWKVRRNLNTTHGDALGDMIANSLFLGWMTAFDQTEIKSIIETQWLTLDDDDGDIDNGTPNYLDIDSAFREQAYPGFDLTWVDFQSVTQLSDTTNEAGPYVVDALLSAPYNPPVMGAKLSYRVDGGPTIDVPMTNVAGSLWRAEIPGQTAPAEVEYEIHAEDALGGANVFPPRDDMFPFRVGIYNVILATEFEPASDEGWTAGVFSDNATTGIWERGEPIGTGAQPELDHTLDPGEKCWFTGQGSPGGSLGENDIDNGRTTLVSPIFDLSNRYDPMISYWRWYSNNTGASPNQDVFEIDITNNGGGTWVNVETVGPDGIDASAGWRFHRFRVEDFVVPTEEIQMRFVAADLDPGSVVEAAIDDFRADDLGPVGCSVPTKFCGTSANSVGSGALIETTGSLSVAANAFGISVTGAPANAMGLVFYGQNQGNSPLGDGIRCVRGKVYRMAPVMTNAQGVHNELFDLANPPQAPAQIGAGQTWNFQFWYADPTGPGGTGSNLTDGVEVIFCN